MSGGAPQEVHPTAVVEQGARLGEGVRIGPYCVVGPEVTLERGVTLASHVVVTGRTVVGEGTRIWPFASVGHEPQDLKYAGEATRLSIGRNCVIREHVTLNTGTVAGGGHTQVGNGCLLMIGAHVAHDCEIGDGVIMANNATLGGHVRIGDGAVLGGLVAVHQFVRIGTGAMIGGMTGVERDVIPFATALGDRAELGGLNVIGLKRRGYDRAAIRDLRTAYQAIFHGPGALPERARAAAERFAASEPVQQIAAFILADSRRQFCTPRGA